MADIICPGCRGCYHETTDQFDPEATPHGGMFRLKQEYRDNAWGSFFEQPSTNVGEIECPSCGCLYVGSGTRVVIDGEVPKKAHNDDALLTSLRTLIASDGNLTNTELGDKLGVSRQKITKLKMRL